MKVNLGVSNRHVHLTKETYEILFDDVPLTIKRKISQPHQFASNQTVDVIINNRTIEHVRIVGPLRDYNQIELLASDFLDDEVKPPRRQSGDLKGSHAVTLRHNDKEVHLDSGLILAERHIHMDKSMAECLHFKSNDKVYLYKNDEYYFDALIKVTDKATFELHIDKDEAKTYFLTQDEELEIHLTKEKEETTINHLGDIYI